MLTGIIEGFGRRIGYQFVAISRLVLTLVSYFLVEKKDAASDIRGQASHIGGMSREEAVKSPKFYLMMLVMLVFYAACGIQQQLPSLLEDMDFSSAQVGMMISVMTAGLAVGKILQGILYSKIGMAKGAVVISSLFAGGLWMLSGKALVVPGMVCLAVGLGIISTLFPTAVRFAFGAREFAAIWSLLSVVGSVGSFIGRPVWGMVYDRFGSYAPALTVAPVLILGALVCLLLVLRENKY